MSGGCISKTLLAHLRMNAYFEAACGSEPALVNWFCERGSISPRTPSPGTQPVTPCSPEFWGGFPEPLWHWGGRRAGGGPGPGAQGGRVLERKSPIAQTFLAHVFPTGLQYLFCKNNLLFWNSWRLTRGCKNSPESLCALHPVSPVTGSCAVMGCGRNQDADLDMPPWPREGASPGVNRLPLFFS